ncbi:MAG: hypothetical protein PHR16_01350 [Methylovulum sp.]|nr:hypothetical protein [Methylovulum sp.]
MIKKQFLLAVCVVSALFTSESFAIDKMQKAVSGEVACIGSDGLFPDGKVTTNFVFRNLDTIRSISFTKISLYTEGGQLVSSLLPANFPASFREIIGPSVSTALNSTELLNGVTGGRLTLKISFKTTDGIAAIAPHAVSAQVDFAANGDRISRDTIECVYTLLK